MVSLPCEFIWCGVLFTPGKSSSILQSETLYETLLSKMSGLSSIECGIGYTLDFVVEGPKFYVQADFSDGISRNRSVLCPEKLLFVEAPLLTPDRGVGQTFVQIVVGEKRFLRTAISVLFPEDGWPADMVRDLDMYVDDLTLSRCMVGAVWPSASPPVITSPDELIGEQSSHFAQRL